MTGKPAQGSFILLIRRRHHGKAGKHFRADGAEVLRAMRRAVVAAQRLGAGVLRGVCPKMGELPQVRVRGAARLQTPPLDLELEGCGLELLGVSEGSQS